MAQTRLTKEQIDRFYNDYVRIKTKGNYAGIPMEREVWRNQMEELLVEEATGKNWSNTEIRRVSHLLARGDAWSRKKVNAFEYYMTKEFDPNDELGAERDKLLEAIREEFGEDPRKVLRQKQGALFQFLLAYSGDWNQYFNS